MKFSAVIPLLLLGLSSIVTGAPAHPEQPMITTKPDIGKAVDGSQKRNAAYASRPISDCPNLPWPYNVKASDIIEYSSKLSVSSASTSTALCPSAVPSAHCEIGMKFATLSGSNQTLEFNLLPSGQSVTDRWTCHQLCLANPACKSFYTKDHDRRGDRLDDPIYWENDFPESLECIGSPENISPPANDISLDGKYTLYDRNCQQHLPAACTPTPTTSVSKMQSAPATATATSTSVLSRTTFSSIATAPSPTIPPPDAFLGYAGMGCPCIINGTASLAVYTTWTHASTLIYVSTTSWKTRHYTSPVNVNWTTVTMSVP
ncbi:hypothetical protein G7Y89_g6767 [Cudoniella acicularis]|uniref:Apple domain-containing protein n=1 Tax=Cudoniella acicularis TaxID=354080 RepID=A0A8H4RM49_9HELO|nr:hypothetical protein G7Y89_g6767 [Cudoniella acicularis]